MAEKVIVIGAGPGGYIAAIRAAQLGFAVTCIESWRTPQGQPALGGTCLNVGCIPSKALLASSEAFEHAQHGCEQHGIGCGDLKIDIAKMLARKDGIVNKMTKGIEFLFRKNKIEWIKGQGRLVRRTAEGYEVAVQQPDSPGGQQQTLAAAHVIIATGSVPRRLPQIPVDGHLVVDNQGALSFESVPKRLAVIGAGVIGLELGSVWRRLGSQVTLFEASPTLLGTLDHAISKEALKIFTKQGLQIQLNSKVTDVVRHEQHVTLKYEQGGEKHENDFDRLIVATGRVPYTEGLGLEDLGLKLDAQGRIEVDDHCRTTLPGLYAIGDVVRGPMLAHKAEDEGIMVAERIAGQKPEMDYRCVPWVIYTQPEIAWVGATEQELQQQNREVRVGHFPFGSNGRALGLGQSEGFVKMVVDAHSDEVLGVHIIGPNASELIAEAVMALEFRASAEDIARICHAHPSLSEVVREAALASAHRALNG